jgi:MraZ protein
MAPFFSRYEHALDQKGRLTLPARFRPAFERGGFLTQHDDGCLALWPPQAFEELMGQMRERATRSPADRHLVRVWASTSSEVEMDRQGRIAIPAHQRAFAGLTGEVLVNGMIDHVEIWDPERFRRVVEPAERRLQEGGD